MPFGTSKNTAVWLLHSFMSIKDHVLHVSLRKKKRLKIVVVFLFRCWAKISQALAGDQQNSKIQNSTYSTLYITINSPSHFKRINNFNGNFLHWQILSLVCPLKNHVTLLSSHSILKHMQKMAGIVNKVNSKQVQVK